MQIDKLSHYGTYDRCKWGIQSRYTAPSNYMNEVCAATQNVSAEIAIPHKEKGLSKENTQTGADRKTSSPTNYSNKVSVKMWAPSSFQSD